MSEQGSPEWKEERRGLVTCSRFKDVLGTKAKRQTYALECVTERLTGVYTEHYVNQAMQWGTDNEGMARMCYEIKTGEMVIVPEYCPHPTIPLCGGSADGLINDDGMIEIKCPQSKTHITTILNGMDDEHLPQVQGYMWVYGRQWCDFISFDPRMPVAAQLYIQRVPRDEDYIKKLATEVIKFLAEVDAMHQKILSRKVPE